MAPTASMAPTGFLGDPLNYGAYGVSGTYGELWAPWTI